jgi:uncharacterized protein
MKRAAFIELTEWLRSSDRKPLVMRGARQVGKTWLVRALAKSADLQLIELNFEDRKQDFSFFRTNDPQTTLREIGASRGITIDPKNSLLFLDEIQVIPALLPKLRWFAEKLPELAVIATGSLLDFVLETSAMSMPVGRINYFYIEPLSFEEFLVALDKKGLLDYIKTYRLGGDIPESIHEQLMELFKEFMIIGGLPAAVSSWSKEQSLMKVNQIHKNLLTTYRDDFGKYRERIAKERLDDVIMSVPKQLAQKFVYRRANPNIHSTQLAQALNLLNKARVSHKVISCHANGLPLAAETNDKYFKEILLDVGLCSAELGLTLNEIQSTKEINLINTGSIAEQAAGQILCTIFPRYIDPALYCWTRMDAGKNSEVDYILQHKSRVVPLEVKAGKTGSLKSLHYFMGKKGFKLAARVNSDYPSLVDVNMKDTAGNPVSYTLVSIPFYLLGQIHRLLDFTNKR